MDVDIAKPCTGPRPKHEDKDDKAQRKRAVKEQRRVCVIIVAANYKLHVHYH